MKTFIFLFLACNGNRLRLTGGPLLSFYNRFTSVCSNKAIFLILKPLCVGCTVLTSSETSRLDLLFSWKCKTQNCIEIITLFLFDSIGMTLKIILFLSLVCYVEQNKQTANNDY